jgi:hypothetical protein
MKAIAIHNLTRNPLRGRIVRRLLKLIDRRIE